MSTEEGLCVVAVASGKGGTGKTTVAVNLAASAPAPAVYADCDVEAPDGALFLRPEIDAEREFCQPLPRFDLDLCDGCGVCHDVCEYRAILVADTPLLFPDRCHACGACAELCPASAIMEAPVRRGELRAGHRGELLCYEGRLELGEASPTALVRAVRGLATSHRRLVVLDASPGTSCPVIATAHRSDFLLLVTEPTPLGLHDLELAVELGKALALPMGVVINRAGDGDDLDVSRFAATHGVPVLGRIPFDREIAAAYAQGELIVDVLPETRPVFDRLWSEVLLRSGR